MLKQETNILLEKNVINMKGKTIYLILIMFVFNSCASQHEKHTALNNYISTLISDNNSKVIIAKEKINPNIAIELFKISALDQYGSLNTNPSIYKEKHWKQMQTKYEVITLLNIKNVWDTTDFWDLNNFNFKGIILESMNTNKGIEGIFKKYNDDYSLIVYSFSEPIYYHHKRFIIFTTIKGTMHSARPRIIIMKKIKNRWTEILSGSDPNVMD